MDAPGTICVRLGRNVVSIPTDPIGINTEEGVRVCKGLTGGIVSIIFVILTHSE
jgi:hypothetical protein